MRMKKIAIFVVVLVLIAVSSFSTLAVTYVHDNQTIWSEESANAMNLLHNNKSWTHKYNLEAPVVAFGDLASAYIGVSKGGAFSADKACTEVNQHNSKTKSVHAISRNGTGNAMQVLEDSGPLTCYIETKGQLWVAINNLYFHNCATTKDNRNLTYIWN